MDPSQATGVITRVTRMQQGSCDFGVSAEIRNRARNCNVHGAARPANAPVNAALVDSHRTVSWLEICRHSLMSGDSTYFTLKCLSDGQYMSLPGGPDP